MRDVCSDVIYITGKLSLSRLSHTQARFILLLDW